MREMKLVGLHHLQKGRVGDYTTCYGFAYSPFEPLSVKNASNQSQLSLWVDANNKLSFGVADTFANIKAGLSQIRLGKFIDDRTDVVEFTIGMRVDPLNPSPTAGYPLICLYNLTPATGGTNAPSYTLVSQPNANSAAVGGYYEFVFTLMPVGTAGSKIDIYLDKQFLSTVTLATNVGLTNIKNFFLTFGRMGVICFQGTQPGIGGYETSLFTMEDIYCCYDTVTADGTTRKGPMRIKPLAVDVNLDTAWQTSDGSARADCLNLADHHGSVTTPYVISPTNMSPMSLRRVITPILDTDTIVAVAGLTSAYRDAGQAASLSAKWRYGSDLSADVTYLPTAGNYTTLKDVPLPTLTTMPDGSPITKNKLVNLEMVLTPV